MPPRVAMYQPSGAREWQWISMDLHVFLESKILERQRTGKTAQWNQDSINDFYLSVMYLCHSKCFELKMTWWLSPCNAPRPSETHGLSMQGHPLASTEPQKVLIHQTKDCSLTTKDDSRSGKMLNPNPSIKKPKHNEEIYSWFYSVHFVKTQRSCFVDFLPKHKFWSANVVVDLAWRFKLAQVQIKTFAGFHRIL